MVWRILSPYLINIRKCSPEEAFDAIKNWLDRCSSLRRLDFNPIYVIKYNVSDKKDWLSTCKSGQIKDRKHILIQSID